MTREKAIQNIKRFGDLLDTLSESSLIESLGMAIDALSDDAAGWQKGANNG